MDLSLSARSVDDRTVLEVGGEIDVYTAPDAPRRRSSRWSTTARKS